MKLQALKMHVMEKECVCFNSVDMSNHALQKNSPVQGSKHSLALNLTINHFVNICLVHMIVAWKISVIKISRLHINTEPEEMSQWIVILWGLFP